MAIYFTDNQYLKTAEEDYEAAEIVFGHKYYDVMQFYRLLLI